VARHPARAHPNQRVLTCCDKHLQEEVYELFTWTNGIRTELDGFYHLWSTQQEMAGREMTELSVKLDLLKADLDHYVDAHLIPMQAIINGLSQAVLTLMGEESNGLLPFASGCGRRPHASQPQGEARPRAPSPLPILVPTSIYAYDVNDSVPSLESVSSSSNSSEVSDPSSASSYASSWVGVSSDYPRIADLYRRLEEGSGPVPEGELEAILEAAGSSSGPSSEVAHASA
jgi:hypothetical protein